MACKGQAGSAQRGATHKQHCCNRQRHSATHNLCALAWRFCGLSELARNSTTTTTTTIATTYAYLADADAVAVAVGLHVTHHHHHNNNSGPAYPHNTGPHTGPTPSQSMQLSKKPHPQQAHNTTHLADAIAVDAIEQHLARPKRLHCPCKLHCAQRPALAPPFDSALPPAILLALRASGLGQHCFMRAAGGVGHPHAPWIDRHDYCLQWRCVG